MTRTTPSLVGIPGGSTDRSAVSRAALVKDRVLLIAPRTWSEVPVQSTNIRSPFFSMRQARRIGLSSSMPSSSIQSSKENSPSGSSATAARVRRSA